jgi:LuxR family transcriptional regulator, maltose regulon positive regulatory protein
MMTYFLDTNLDSGDIYSPLTGRVEERPRRVRSDSIHLLAEKLNVPRFRGHIDRPRLHDLLNRSIEQFPATLVSGRAGTGKTALASSFARARGRTAWYSVESSDFEWSVFVQYFAACLLKSVKSKVRPSDLLPADTDPSQSSMATSLINVFAEVETVLSHEPLLIVLDGIHHLFDAHWFGEFFGLLLSSLPENVSLLLLCRSKPPNPLWRLRSKQQLNVIDEKLLAFNLFETLAFASKRGLNCTDAERAHAETFGRISKLIEFADREKRRSRT